MKFRTNWTTEEMKEDTAAIEQRLSRASVAFRLLFIEFAMQHDLSAHEQALILAWFQHEHMAGIVGCQPLRNMFLDSAA